MSTEKRKLVIVQNLLGEVSDREIYDTLGVDQDALKLTVIRFSDDHRMAFGRTINKNWPYLKVQQEAFYREKIEPLLVPDEDNEGEDLEVYYFGWAPVPLAIHLGFLIPASVRVVVFQRRQTDEIWTWSGVATPAPIVSPLPTSPYHASGDVVLRIGTSYRVIETETGQSVARPIAAIDIQSPEPDLDLFGSEESLKEYASTIQNAIHQINVFLRDADAVHLFAAVPCGLAFLIGHRMNPNTTKLIYTYEYSSSRTPPYKKAFSLQGRDPLTFEITEDDREELHWRRNYLEDELKRFQRDVKALQAKPKAKNWFRYLFARKETGTILFDTSMWSSLLPVFDTSFMESKMVYVPHSIAHDEGRNLTYSAKTWYFPDNFLYSLREIVGTKNRELLLAAKLLWIQEVIKSDAHDVHSDNIHELARYPAILEEVDYQADVYAILHVYKLSKISIADATSFFKYAIRILLATMWSTDRMEYPDEMELRRVNRYLIWYYFLCLIEDKSPPLKKILQLLSKKPTVELRLARVMASDQSKVMIELKAHEECEIALAAFHNNRIITSRQQLPMNQLIEGFKSRNGDAVMEVMRQFVRDLD